MDEDRAGEVLEGKYRLVRPLGEGGMGEVWLAEHLRLARPVAIKLLRSDLTGSARTVERFRREAVAASRIGNPHIVEVLDMGAAPNGAPFIAMELLEGRTLFQLLRETPLLPIPRAADVVSQVLSGLAAAHRQGIVHRDLKPANVFLTRFGTRDDFVKIVDFGISKILGGEAAQQLTRVGALLGTPTYMAPEQVRTRKDMDHRVDLWASGVLLYLALTGRRPHEAPSQNELLAAIVKTDVAPFRHLRPEIDPPLERIVLRALRRDVGQRWQSADEFREALLPYREHAPGASAASATPTPAFSFAAVRDSLGRLSSGSAPPSPESGGDSADGEESTVEAVPGAKRTSPAAASAAVQAKTEATDEGQRISMVWEIEPVKRPGPARTRPEDPDASRGPGAPSPSGMPSTAADPGAASPAIGRARTWLLAAAVAIAAAVTVFFLVRS